MQSVRANVFAVRLDDDTCWERLRTARHGVLSTLHPERGVDAVPVVFVVLGGQIVLPIDTVKAKSGARLQRLRNLDADPRSVLLVDRYQADWSELWWVRAHGRAHEGSPSPEQREALSSAFGAYRAAGSVTSVILLDVDELTGWQADAPDRPQP